MHARDTQKAHDSKIEQWHDATPQEVEDLLGHMRRDADLRAVVVKYRDHFKRRPMAKRQALWAEHGDLASQAHRCYLAATERYPRAFADHSRFVITLGLLHGDGLLRELAV